MKFSAAVFGAVVALAAQSLAAGAAPAKSYPALVSTIIADARAECRSVGGKSMSVSGEAVESVDLNGDGLQDYLVDYGQFGCNGAASLFCGTAGCRVEAVVATSPTQYRRVQLDNLRGFEVVKVDNVTLLQVNLHGSACGKVGAYDCVKRWRYVAGRFEPYPPVQAAKAVPPEAPGSATANWQLMTLRNGQKVAFIRPGGQIPTLSFGCQTGGATMMVETLPGAIRGSPAVILRGRDGVAISTAPASRNSNFLLIRPVSADLVAMLTAPDSSVALEIGNATMANIPTNGAKSALETALAGCRPVQPMTAVARPVPAQPAPPPPPSASAKGILGIPIRHGYYVPEYEQCQRAGSVMRFGTKGHAEADSTSPQWVEIPWRRAVRQRDGSYVVQYLPSPGEVAGDEIEISIKPLSETRIAVMIQDTVIMRLCERSQLPRWVR